MEPIIPRLRCEVNGVAGGNATVGTAVSNADGSITYTAPAVVPTPSNIVQLTDHQRRQSGGVDCAEHLGDESDSDSYCRHAHVVCSRSGNHRAQRAEIHQRRAGAGERIACAHHV